MNISDEEKSLGFNRRLRPRKSNVSNIRSSEEKDKSGRINSDLNKKNLISRDVTTNKAEIIQKPKIPDKQFLCPYCDKIFSSKQTLSKHIKKSHLTKQNIFTCLFCNHTEHDPSIIINHMNNSHPNQYFACLNCLSRLSSTSELSEHKLIGCQKQKLTFYNQGNNVVNIESYKTPQPFKLKGKDENTKIFSDNHHNFRGVVISCELKPSQVHDQNIDIEDKITTNLILPSNKKINQNMNLEKDAMIVLDDIQWSKKIPTNFSFHQNGANQILSKLGVIHKSKSGHLIKRNPLQNIDFTPQKFEKCFDTNFYTKVASNVQENLAKFLDGSLNFNANSNIIKTRKSKNIVTINTIEGYPIILLNEQLACNDYKNYFCKSLSYKYKSEKKANSSVSTFCDEAAIKSDAHTDNCIVTLISRLDISTQLRMKQKHEISNSVKMIQNQCAIDEELKEILESKEIPVALPFVHAVSKNNVDTKKESFAKLFDLIPSKPVDDLQPAILSGEWARPRCYICGACGFQTPDSKVLSTHALNQHPNVEVHYNEIAGELLMNSDICKHLYGTYKPVSHKSRPQRGLRECTKCKVTIPLRDLHQHMLECAGDTPTVRRRCRSRPFGIRKRRPRLPDNTIRKRIRKGIPNSRCRRREYSQPENRMKIRSELGDGETIRKMLAGLPAKRRRVMVHPLNTNIRQVKKNKSHNSKIIIQSSSFSHSTTKKLLKNQKQISSKEKNCEDQSNNIENTILKRLRPRKLDKDFLNTKSLEGNSIVNDTSSLVNNMNSGSDDVQKLPLDQNRSDRIDIHSGSHNSRQHSDRNGSPDRQNEQPNINRQNENAPNGGPNDNAPVQNVPLKHSIARLTANTETHDKSVQFHQLFLVQQECNNDINSEHEPTGQQLLFENDVVVKKFDKPPLSSYKSRDLDSLTRQKFNKPRKGLNDCINMLKNKLVENVGKSNTASVSCGNDDPIYPLVISNHKTSFQRFESDFRAIQLQKTHLSELKNDDNCQENVIYSNNNKVPNKEYINKENFQKDTNNKLTSENVWKVKSSSSQVENPNTKTDHCDLANIVESLDVTKCCSTYKETLSQDSKTLENSVQKQIIQNSNTQLPIIKINSTTTSSLKSVRVTRNSLNHIGKESLSNEEKTLNLPPKQNSPMSSIIFQKKSTNNSTNHNESVLVPKILPAHSNINLVSSVLPLDLSGKSHLSANTEISKEYETLDLSCKSVLEPSGIIDLSLRSRQNCDDFMEMPLERNLSSNNYEDPLSSRNLVLSTHRPFEPNCFKSVKPASYSNEKSTLKQSAKNKYSITSNSVENKKITSSYTTEDSLDVANCLEKEVLHDIVQLKDACNVSITTKPAINLSDTFNVSSVNTFDDVESNSEKTEKTDKELIKNENTDFEKESKLQNNISDLLQKDSNILKISCPISPVTSRNSNTVSVVKSIVTAPLKPLVHENDLDLIKEKNDCIVANNNISSVQVLPEVNNISSVQVLPEVNVSPCVQQDSEMSSKITTLPKELVDVLDTIPIDHRNQLLNILPQYVTPTFSGKINSDAENEQEVRKTFTKTAPYPSCSNEEAINQKNTFYRSNDYNENRVETISSCKSHETFHVSTLIENNEVISNAKSSATSEAAVLENNVSSVNKKINKTASLRAVRIKTQSERIQSTSVDININDKDTKSDKMVTNKIYDQKTFFHETHKKSPPDFHKELDIQCVQESFDNTGNCEIKSNTLLDISPKLTVQHDAIDAIVLPVLCLENKTTDKTQNENKYIDKNDSDDDVSLASIIKESKSKKIKKSKKEKKSNRKKNQNIKSIAKKIKSDYSSSSNNLENGLSLKQTNYVFENEDNINEIVTKDMIVEESGKNFDLNNTSIEKREAVVISNTVTSKRKRREKKNDDSLIVEDVFDSKNTCQKELNNIYDAIPMNVKLPTPIPLRRSQRGKSCLISNENENQTIQDQHNESRLPLTKKQLIFSKLMLDEDNKCLDKQTDILDSDHPINNDDKSNHSLNNSLEPIYKPLSNYLESTSELKPFTENKKNEVVLSQEFNKCNTENVKTNKKVLCYNTSNEKFKITSKDADPYYLSSDSDEVKKVSIKQKSVKSKIRDRKTKSRKPLNSKQKRPKIMLESNQELLSNQQSFEDKDDWKDKQISEGKSPKLIQMSSVPFSEPLHFEEEYVTSDKNDITSQSTNNLDLDKNFEKSTKVVSNIIKNMANVDVQQKDGILNSKCENMINYNQFDSDESSKSDVPLTEYVKEKANSNIFSRGLSVKTAAINSENYDTEISEKHIHNDSCLDENVDMQEVNFDDKLNTEKNSIMDKIPIKDIIDDSNVNLNITDLSDCRQLFCRNNKNTSDSDESSKSDVPLNKYVCENNEKHVELLTDIADTNESYKNVNDSHIVNKYQNSKIEDQRSEEFMEKFGFFSERKPRKSNIIATKKIETLHSIAKQSDHEYFGLRKKSLGKKLSNELENNKKKLRKLSKKYTNLKRKPNNNFRICLSCKKKFRKEENYLRHNISLLHVAKLLEKERKTKPGLFDESKYLMTYLKHFNLIEKSTSKLIKSKKHPKKFDKIVLPTLLEILEDVNNTIKLKNKDLDQDEKEFLICCELLKNHYVTDLTATEATRDSNTNLNEPFKSLQEFNNLSNELITDEDEFQSDCDISSLLSGNLLKKNEMEQLQDYFLSNMKSENCNISNSKFSEEYLERKETIAEKNITIIDSNKTSNKNVSNPKTIEVSDNNKIKKIDNKSKMYPDIIEDIDMYEDKFDKIKRKCRSQAAAAKQTSLVRENLTRMNYRKKSNKKSSKSKTKRNHNNTVLTKGALKVFDSIKVSIPTADINISALVPSGKFADKKGAVKKKKVKKIEQTKKIKFPVTKEPLTSKVDIYDFMDNEDADLFEVRPSTMMERFKSITYKDTPSTSKTTSVVKHSEHSSASLSDGDDFVYMSDDYVCSDNETENSLMSSETGTDKPCNYIKKSFCVSKKRDSVDKNAVMGKIFKHNALRCNKKPSKKQGLHKNKTNLDKLFDSLLEDNNDIVSESKQNLPVTAKNTYVLKNYETEFSQQCSCTTSAFLCNDENFDNSKLNKCDSCQMTKIYPSGKKPIDLEEFSILNNEIKTKSDDDFINDIKHGHQHKASFDVSLHNSGLAKQRIRRKCTVGKQNVLSETWSSESESGTDSQYSNGTASLISGNSRKRKAKRKEILNSNKINKLAIKIDDKSLVESDISNETFESDKQKVNVSNPTSSTVSENKLHERYYWSSDDGETREHRQQHGWIVGNSHKKLVTMLANAKGKKHSNDDKKHLLE